MKALFRVRERFEVVQYRYEELDINPTKPERITLKDAKKNDCEVLFYTSHNLSQFLSTGSSIPNIAPINST